MNILEKLKHFLFNRRVSYGLVFNPENPSVEVVLKDLAKFCRANETAFNPDPRIHAVLEGRREVYLRILDHTKLDSESFINKYGKGQLDE